MKKSGIKSLLELDEKIRKSYSSKRSTDTETTESQFQLLFR